MGKDNAEASCRELGARLRARREALGITGPQISRRTGWSLTKISCIESGHAGTSLMDLVWYLGICQVKHADAVPLIDLCRRANADRGYWLSSHGQWVPDMLSSLIYHESTAQASTSYEPQLMPGLVQTEGYARAMIGREQWRSIEDVARCSPKAPKWRRARKNLGSSSPRWRTSTTEGVHCMQSTEWRKSSSSGGGGSDCVEVAVADNRHRCARLEACHRP